MFRLMFFLKVAQQHSQQENKKKETPSKPPGHGLIRVWDNLHCCKFADMADIRQGGIPPEDRSCYSPPPTGRVVFCCQPSNVMRYRKCVFEEVAALLTKVYSWWRFKVIPALEMDKCIARSEGWMLVSLQSETWRTFLR
jgi:hypothetical protein